MKMYLVSDNIDTQMGMRLAGIEGVVVHEKDEVIEALEKVKADEEVAVVLITEKVCHDYVYEMKLSSHRPLVVTIPDRHSETDITDSIGGYVRDAIGIKL